VSASESVRERVALVSLFSFSSLLFSTNERNSSFFSKFVVKQPCIMETLYLVVIAGLACPASLNYENKEVQSFDADVRSMCMRVFPIDPRGCHAKTFHRSSALLIFLVSVLLSSSFHHRHQTVLSSVSDDGACYKYIVNTRTLVLYGTSYHYRSSFVNESSLEENFRANRGIA